MTPNTTEHPTQHGGGSEAIPTVIAVWTSCLVLLWFYTAFYLDSGFSGDLVTFSTLVVSAATVLLHANRSRVKNNRQSPATNSPQGDSPPPDDFVSAALGLTALLNSGGAAANCSVSFSAFIPSLLISTIGAWCLCRLYQPKRTQLETQRGGNVGETESEKTEINPDPAVNESALGIAELPAPSKSSAGLVEAEFPTTNPIEFETDTPVLRESQTVLTASGERTSSGIVNAEVAPSEKSMELVIAFDPPFVVPPEFEFELTEESLQARLLNRTCSGVRMAVRSLQAADSAPIPFSLEWFAQEPEDAATVTTSQPVSTNLP